MCEHCEPNTMAEIFEGDGVCEPYIYILNGRVYLEFNCMVEDVPINNCPMCGRVLRGGDAE